MLLQFFRYVLSSCESLYSSITRCSIIFLVSELRGCATSLKEPSFFLRDGIETKRPFELSIILRSRIIKQLSITIVAYALSLPSFAGYTFTSVISIILSPIDNADIGSIVLLIRIDVPI